MDKPVKRSLKKSFIRNPELTKPKTVIIKDSEHSAPPPTISEKPQSNAPEKFKTRLNEPELHSTLKIIKEIESVNSIKLKKPGITEFADKKHVLLEEKASKQVNFPHHQKIYKDLIPLAVNTRSHPLPTITRDYQIIKDEEPVLANFYTPKKLPEYSFQVSVQTSHKNLNRQFDGFKIYRTMRNWN